MERRVLLAIFLSFLVLYGYQALFVRPAAPPSSAAASSQGTTAGGPQVGSSGGSAQETSSAVTSPTAAGAQPVLGESIERDIRVETPDVIAVFTNRGGRLKSWQLKGYRRHDGRPLDLISSQQLSSQQLPFSLRTQDVADTNVMNGALYVAREVPGDGVQASRVRVSFVYRDSANLEVEKEFSLDPSGFTVSFRATVSKNGQRLNPEVVWGPGLGDDDSQTGGAAARPGGLQAVGGTVARLDAKAIASQSAYEGEFDYAGVDDHYFAAIALKPGRAKVSYQSLTIPPPSDSSAPAQDFMGYSIAFPRIDEPVTYYIGPKEFDSLAVIDRNLVKAINFGMFSVIVVPLLRSLNWIHGYVGNYGWAILLLTLIINLVLFPLNHKSVVSMRKMQEVQPEAKAIQERYAKLSSTDPARQKMNQELMALYRERGVNPASGCIPILLTLPVFLAFYALLTTAIELRGAPFVGWIVDLSRPDPYYVMPVLVGLSQVLTQWMTPQTGVDPTQQKVMLIMPVVLIFVFVSTPAGALIYWLVGNVWRMGQQWLTNYLIGPPNIRTIRPAAERRLKRVGGGKTEGAAREK